MRSDAQLNRQRIVEIARHRFARDGVNAPLDAIAMEAGVGPGTLYRHFPTREALLSAVLAATHAQLLECERSERTNPDCAAALDRWLEALRFELTMFSGLSEPVLKAVKEVDSPLALTCQTLIEITDSFLKPAQEVGTVRGTVTASELFLLTLGLGWLEDKAGLYGTSMDKLKSILCYGYLLCSPHEEMPRRVLEHDG